MNDDLILGSPYLGGNRLRVGLGLDVIAFGQESSDFPYAVRWVHFKKSDWERIKSFVDAELTKNDKED